MLATAPAPDPTVAGNTAWYYYCYPWLMRVTSKGQVTIPRDVRRRLGIETGTEVDFEIDGDVVRLVRRTQGRGVALVEQMRGHRLSMTTDEIMALTRGES
ncbi:hypothetical protein LRC484719_46390 [Mycobacterium riyadhense]|uniref:SpoVT / AbrB like domain protein n=2 Tax=Mycobacterium riyadhense TaxID=486698 RepID=A0A653F439_9MYCO|nr:SpoVT / AbrB like domain protein [Mycobacterium riyadhense]